MTKNHCPLGEDCDLLIAYEYGLSSAKDIILQNGKLEAERDEARMQSLADLGQAQDAYEAQKKAEAERDRYRRQRDHYRDVLKGISTNINAMLKPIGETEK